MDESTLTTTAVHRRRIRSFVRRAGRMTSSQRRALEELWPVYGIDFREEVLDPAETFGRSARCVLDVGFGDGEALVTSAANHPDIDYVGVEVHEPGIGHALILIERARLTNVRVINRDVVDVTGQMLADSSFDAVNLFFPDPWPKKRHHKRRLVQPAFIAEVQRILKPGGLLHIATDWSDYAEQVTSMLADAPAFVAVTGRADDPLAFRPPTKFERRGRRLGHDVFDLYYRLVATGAKAPVPCPTTSADR